MVEYKKVYEWLGIDCTGYRLLCKDNGLQRFYKVEVRQQDLLGGDKWVEANTDAAFYSLVDSLNRRKKFSSLQ